MGFYTTIKINKGGDGLIQSAVIQTGNGITNHPITKLYPLEIRSESPPNIEEQDTDDVNKCDDDTTNTTTTQPLPRSTVREAATKAHQRFCEWAQILGVPPEDVEAD